ncbi:hypothetical protein [Terriglobus sp.]|uniref:hypothetical protein n=1 Tax=Terriglobus sp. TaxID=1889013 RepID=UPI003B003C28
MATKKASATKAASRKTPAKKTSGTNSAAKKAPAKRTSAKKASAKKSAAKKAPAKVPGQRSAPKKTSAPDKYTDPALRERIKAKVIREDKGGRAGQWSARKAQMVAHEYEAEGGKYKGGRDTSQKNLTAWGDEHWTTADGKPARRKDGMHRYLPEKAWKELSPAEKRSTEKKKLAGDKQGKQFVANTAPAVKARRGAEKSKAGR